MGPSCLRLFVNTRRTWDGARASCRQQGGDLFLVNNAVFFSNDLMNLLASITNSETNFYVGLRLIRSKFGLNNWLWIDETSVNKQQWKHGYPLSDEKYACGVLSRINGELMNTDCSSMNGFICESRQGT